jgi:hypothetical protein
MSFAPFLPDPTEVGQEYPDPNDTGRTWIWDGDVWRLKTEVVVVYEGGPPGATGIGVPGLQGATGLSGATGQNGQQGATGAAGVGLRGTPGATGETGEKGDTGVAVCEAVGVVPPVGQRGRLYIDSSNQIYVTLREAAA